MFFCCLYGLLYLGAQILFVLLQKIVILFQNLFRRITSVTETSFFYFFDGLDGFDDFLLISNDGNHLLLHRFVQVAIFVSNLYILCIFLDESEYFLKDAVVDCIGLYFIRAFAIFLRVNIVELFIDLFLEFIQLIPANIVLEDTQLFLYYIFFQIIQLFYPWHFPIVLQQRFPSFSILFCERFHHHYRAVNAFAVVNIILFLADLLQTHFNFLIDCIKVHRYFICHLLSCNVDEFLYDLIADVNAVLRFQSFSERIQSVEGLRLFFNLELFFQFFAD